MIYELTVALRYLLPKRRQLSASIISLLSIAVISLVVWLIVVFFSVTHGLENRWIDRLIAMTAPIRVTPTAQYYHSYYYNSDAASLASNYQLKTLKEKRDAEQTDPYDPTVDLPLDPSVLPPDQDGEGQTRDLVKIAFNTIAAKNLKPRDYTLSTAALHIYGSEDASVTFSENLFLTNYSDENEALKRAQLPKTTPIDLKGRQPIYLAKNFKERGIKENDQGYLAVPTQTLSSLTEGKIPVTVAGFFDPGMFPMGNRFGLVTDETLEVLTPQTPASSFFPPNGIYVDGLSLSYVDSVKKELEQAFAKEDILNYFTLSTYKDFPYTKDFLQQLKSERNLFTVIASVILLVACSNIVSMLIILVNDKKKEIGSLRAQGAEAISIALIFGFCGMIMGFIGSAIGITLALFTLRNLRSLTDLISRLQGFDAFNPLYFGETLPNTVSFEALLFVIITTSLISLIAGIVPAIQASTQDPAKILRSDS